MPTKNFGVVLNKQDLFSNFGFPFVNSGVGILFLMRSFLSKPRLRNKGNFYN